MSSTMYKCAGYYRLSKEDKDRRDESVSIETQRKIINNYAEENNLRIIKEYKDDGYTGTNFDREEFEGLDNDIKSGLINCVIFKDCSRVGRTRYSTGYWLEKNIDNGVRIICIGDKFDSLYDPLEKIADKIFRNASYSIDNSEKILMAFDSKQRRGEFLGSVAPFGYLKDPNNHNHLIVDPKAANIVKYIFRLYVNGLGTKTIANRLNETNIPPISDFYSKVSKTENKWKHPTIKGILNNRVYVGDMISHKQQRKKVGSTKLVKVSKENQICVMNTHEPIISREMFEEAQEIARKKYSANKDNVNHLFAGIIKCGNCHGSMGIYTDRRVTTNEKRKCRCTNKNKYGKTYNCTTNNTDYDTLETTILEYLRSVAQRYIENINIGDFVQQGIENLDERHRELKKNIEYLDNLIDKKNHTLEEAYEDKLNGTVTLDVFKSISNKIQDEINELNVQREKYNKELNLLLLENNGNFIRCREDVEKFLALETPSKEVIKSLIDKIYIYDEPIKRIEVFLKYADLEKYATNL